MIIRIAANTHEFRTQGELRDALLPILLSSDLREPIR